MQPAAPRVTGIVLAAGAGTRAGGPKGLRRGPDGTPWVEAVVAALQAGGCADIVVAVGASADEVAALAPPAARIAVVPDGAEGLAASLRAALAAVDPNSDAALVALVDEPGLPASAVRRVGALAAPDALARAVYGGRPGHPVLLGRDHLAAVAAGAAGDRGANGYLRAHAAREVECGDLWDGLDIDGADDGAGRDGADGPG